MEIIYNNPQLLTWYNRHRIDGANESKSWLYVKFSNRIYIQHYVGLLLKSISIGNHFYFYQPKFTEHNGKSMIFIHLIYYIFRVVIYFHKFLSALDYRILKNIIEFKTCI